MNEVINLILAALAIILCLVAYLLTLGTLFPHRLAGTRRAVEGMTGRALLVGLVNALFFGALGLVVFSAAGETGSQALNALGVLILALLVVGLSFGLAGVAQVLGERLVPNASTMAQNACGSATLSLACALPFIGWFGLLPYVGLLGLGAFILSLFSHRKKSVPPEES